MISTIQHHCDRYGPVRLAVRLGSWLAVLTVMLGFAIMAQAEQPGLTDRVRQATLQEPLPTPPEPQLKLRLPGEQPPLPGAKNQFSEAPVSPLLKKHDIRVKPLSELSVNITPKSGELPYDYAAVDMFDRAKGPESIDTERPWAAPMTFAWEAPSMCHGPLYFEEINVERYGYSFGIFQPVVSAGHFFATFPVLPYMMTVQPPNECVYTLGEHRPGDCVPFECHCYPFDWRAASVEGAFITGLVFLIP